MRHSKVVGLSLSFLITLVVCAVALTPPAVGKLVPADEARTVAGATCFYNSSQTIQSCSPGGHWSCLFTTGGIVLTPNIYATNKRASNLGSIACPCASGFYSYTTGTCKAGS